MGRLHMLDTEIASYIIKSRSAAIEARLAALSPSDVCISAVTRAELRFGLTRLPPSHRLHIAVRRFLELVQTLAWDAGAADYYADIRSRLEQAGQPIGELDMMIAAHSLSTTATLVTNNTRHFSRIDAPLTLVNWSE
jgi:tRNA(fMet)-specific endonuclease VapC